MKQVSNRKVVGKNIWNWRSFLLGVVAGGIVVGVLSNIDRIRGL